MIAQHEIILIELQYPVDTLVYWEMHCTCGAWQHGPKYKVEHAAALHRAEVGEVPRD